MDFQHCFLRADILCLHPLGSDNKVRNNLLAKETLMGNISFFIFVLHLHDCFIFTHFYYLTCLWVFCLFTFCMHRVYF